MPTPPPGVDTDMVVHVCFCGSRLFNVKCMFDDYEISMYFVDMTCAVCGAGYRAPTPKDRP